nr:MAG TPA: hypothetical protein [Bacteriophage sp.]
MDLFLFYNSLTIFSSPTICFLYFSSRNSYINHNSFYFGIIVK